MLEACICFAIQQKKVNHFIIGVDKYVQLKNIIISVSKLKVNDEVKIFNIRLNKENAFFVKLSYMNI